MDIKKLDISDVKHVYLIASKSNEIDKIYVEYNNGDVKTADNEYTEENRYRAFSLDVKTFLEISQMKTRDQDYTVISMNNKLVKELNAKVNETEKRKQIIENGGFDFSVPEEVKEAKVNNIKVDYKNVKELAKTKTEPKKINKTKVTLTALGMAGLLGAVGACSSFGGANEAAVSGIATEAIAAETTENNNEVVEEATVATNETESEKVVKLTLEDKDWAYYDANFSDTFQKQSMKDYYNYLMNFEREDWMNVTITDEMKEVLKEAKIPIRGDKAVFGLTAEQVYNLDLTYGRHTNEELAELLNGYYIDKTIALNNRLSESNKAISALIDFYLNSDDKHLHVEKFIHGWNEDEINRVTEYEDMLQEHADLQKEGKYKEAEAKMLEIRDSLYTYAEQPTIEDDYAKPFILKTFLTACSIISVSNQYMDNITVTLYDVVNATNVDITVKTYQFDEMMMRRIVSGFSGCVDENGNIVDRFNQIEYLEQKNIDPKKYSVVIDDESSIVDGLNGSIISRFDEYNEYIARLRNQNVIADSNSKDNLDNNSEFDKLTEETYEPKVILKLINKELVKDNRYPENMGFFTSVYSKYVQEIIAIKDAKSGANAGKGMTAKQAAQVVKTIPGNTIYVPGETYEVSWDEVTVEEHTETRTEHKEVSAEEIAQEDKEKRESMDEASEIKTTVIDGATGQEKETSYQDIINKMQNDSSMMNGTDKSQLTDNETKTNLDNDDQINYNDPVVKTIKEEVDKNQQAYEQQKEYLEENAKKIYQDEQGTTHYETGGDEHYNDDFANKADPTGSTIDPDIEVYDGYVAPVETPDYTTQSEPPAAPVLQSAPVPAPEPEQVVEPAPEGYINEDPTESYTFAPVYEEPIAEELLNASMMAAPAEPEGFTFEDPTLSSTFAPAVDSDIDEYLDDMEGSLGEDSEGMTR